MAKRYFVVVPDELSQKFKPAKTSFMSLILLTFNN